MVKRQKYAKFIDFCVVLIFEEVVLMGTPGLSGVKENEILLLRVRTLIT